MPLAYARTNARFPGPPPMKGSRPGHRKCKGRYRYDMKKGISLFGRRIRPAYLIIAGFIAAIAISAIFDGPRTVYTHAIIICLDCIGLI
jgi:hypothetical protein